MLKKGGAIVCNRKQNKQLRGRWVWPQCIGFMFIHITKPLHRDKVALLKGDRSRTEQGRIQTKKNTARKYNKGHISLTIISILE